MVKFSLNFLLVILTLFNFMPAVKNVAVEIFPKRAKCMANPKFIHFSQCKIITTNGKTSPNQYVMEFNVLRELQEIWLDIKLHYKFVDRYLLIFNFTDIDVCEMVRGEGWVFGNQVSKTMLAISKKVSPNLLKGCPYKGIYGYTVDINETVSPLLPAFVPTGTWRYQLDFLTKNRKFVASGFLEQLLKST